MYVLSDQTDTGLAIYDLSNFMDGDPSNNVDIATEGLQSRALRKAAHLAGTGRMYLVMKANSMRLHPIEQMEMDCELWTSLTPMRLVKSLTLKSSDEGERASSMYRQFRGSLCLHGWCQATDVRPGVWKQVLQLKTKTAGARGWSTNRTTQEKRLIRITMVIATWKPSHNRGLWPHPRKWDLGPR